MSISEIPLNKIPYSIASRLVDLMPIETLLNFRYVNSETEFLTNRRQVIVKKEFRGNCNNLLQLTAPCYVQEYLEITFHSIADGDLVVPRIHGSYTSLNLSGNYSWRQAMQLCRERVERCYWLGNMELDEQDHAEFIQQLCQILAKRTISLRIQDRRFLHKLRSVVKNLKRDFNCADSFDKCSVSQATCLNWTLINCRHK
uniref:F-box domain-containing protein n=1 Tax=Panagrellus redivivus TaxID=6233 RepID=A0A7E4W281_PANRE